MDTFSPYDIKAFTTWVNLQLQQSQVEIKSIQNEFKDGTKLIPLIENVFNEKIIKNWDHNPSDQTKMKENIQIVFDFLSSKKVTLYGVKNDDIINNKRNAILILIWNLIQHSLINTISYNNANGKNALLQWCREVTFGYHGVKITDFKTSWINCLAFCAIVNHYDPQILNYKLCNEFKKNNNLNIFNSALQKLGIVTYITEENFNDANSEKIFMMQNAILFNFFVNRKQRTNVPDDVPKFQNTSSNDSPLENNSPQKSLFIPTPSNPNQQKSPIVPPPSNPNQQKLPIVSPPSNSNQQKSPITSSPENKSPLIYTHEDRSSNAFQSNQVDAQLYKGTPFLSKNTGFLQNKTNLPDAPIEKIKIEKTKFNFNFIFDEIKKNEKKVDTKGKDIVIFIGETQVGKSTTINCLNGAKYKIKNNKTELINQPNIALAETGGNIGASSTNIPSGYMNNNLLLLDTQGFFDTRDCHNDEEIIGSILLEMAIRNAKSVRAVCMFRFTDLDKGINGLDKVGEIISRLFINNENEMVPIFFLSNHYYSSSSEDMQKYFNKDNKYDYVREKLKDRVKEIKKGIDSGVEKQKNTEYFDLLDYNVKKGNTGYINIESPKTIESLRKKLKDIPIISNDHINIYRSSKLRELFNMHVVYKMITNVEKMAQHILTLKYPAILLESILKQIENSLAMISLQTDNIIKRKIIDQFDSQSFDSKIHEISNAISECDVQIANMKTQIIQLENAKDDDLSQHIQTIDNNDIQELENQKSKLETSIQDLSRNIEEIANNLKNAKNDLDSFDTNYDDALKEKKFLLKDLQRDRETAQKRIYDIDHIIEDMNNMDPLPVFRDRKYVHNVFGKSEWEFNFDEGIIWDYKNPVVKKNKWVDEIDKRIDSTHYNVLFKTKLALFSKLDIEVSLFTWKKFKKDNMAYLRTKREEKESYLMQIERDNNEIENIKNDLEVFTKSNQVLRKIRVNRKTELEGQKDEIQKQLTNQRRSLEQCNIQLDLKKRKKQMTEKENQNKLEQMQKEKNLRKKEISDNLKQLTINKQNLISEKSRIENDLLKNKEEHAKNVKIEYQKKEEIEKRLAQFQQQLIKFREEIVEKSKFLHSIYTEKQYDLNEAQTLVLISQKLFSNQKLCSETQRFMEIIKQAKSTSIYKCETNSMTNEINPELDQNIWITNNATKQRTSIFCFIQEMNNEINLYQKWSEESKLYIVS